MDPHRSPICASVLLLAATLLALPPPAFGQTRHDENSTWRAPMWMGDVTFVSANALLAGLTAGLRQEVRGGSFREGFAGGALGGAVSYAGRRMAVADFAGAGLVGRQIGAVGASMARNAGEAMPLLSRIALPLGPVGFELRRGNDRGVRPRLDLATTWWTILAALDERLELDTGASFSAGAPVFRAPRHRLGSAGDHSLGQVFAGVILLGHDGIRGPSDVLAHERAHVLQYDFAQQLWGDPVETWSGSKIPGGPGVLRFVHVGVTYPLFANSIMYLLDLDWEQRPWEIEAEFLEQR